MHLIDVTDKISLHLDDSVAAFADNIIIEDDSDYIPIAIDDWQAFKDAGDKLVALKRKGGG